MTKDTFLKLNEVEKIVGFGRSWIYREVAKGTFPAPMRIGGGARWSCKILEDWMEEKVEATYDQAER